MGDQEKLANRVSELQSQLAISNAEAERLRAALKSKMDPRLLAALAAFFKQWDEGQRLVPSEEVVQEIRMSVRAIMGGLN